MSGSGRGQSTAAVRTATEAAPPWAEHFYVAAPAVVEDKALPRFEDLVAQIASEMAIF